MYYKSMIISGLVVKPKEGHERPKRMPGQAGKYDRAGEMVFSGKKSVSLHDITQKR